MKKINILGTEYSVLSVVEALKKDVLPEEFTESSTMRGLTDSVNKRIFVMDMNASHILRHEIIHAFLFESGLYEQSYMEESWSANEQVVDWFALQSPKIFKVFKELGIEDGVRKGVA